MDIGAAQGIVLQVLGLAALGVEVFALVDAARHRPDAYVAAGKRTKPFWLAVLAVAAAFGFVTFADVLGFIPLIALVAAGVYLADVRPALRMVSGHGRRTDGPYGPW